jgi:hypothetical protein
MRADAGLHAERTNRPTGVALWDNARSVFDFTKHNYRTRRFGRVCFTELTAPILTSRPRPAAGCKRGLNTVISACLETPDQSASRNAYMAAIHTGKR